MDESWYYLRGGEQHGPVSAIQLKTLAKEGRLGRSDLTWTDGMPDWVPAGSLKGVFSDPPPVPKQASHSPERNGNGWAAASKPVDRAANARMLDQLRQDAADLRKFLDELFRVLVRVNPVNCQVHEFLGHINSIPDQADRQDVANLVGQAMSAVDLANAVTLLDDSDEMIVGMAGFVVRGDGEILAKVWPEYQQAVQHLWIQHPDSEAYRAQESVRRALKTHRQDLIEIQRHFRQLQEFFPRYYRIMSRSGFWDFVTGFASGFFGGELGAAGHEMWENWRIKSDAEFAQTFGNAVDAFTKAALEFTQRTEEAVAAACTALIDEHTRCEEAILAALAPLADKVDLTPIYAALHNSDQNLDENVRQLFEIVLRNLKEQGLSGSSERNLREMLDMQV